MVAGEYRRDTKNVPPRWVEIVHGCTVIKFIHQGKGGVRASSRYSLKEGRANTYLQPKEFRECLLLAQAILNPYRRKIRARPHWMDERDD